MSVWNKTLWWLPSFLNSKTSDSETSAGSGMKFQKLHLDWQGRVVEWLLMKWKICIHGLFWREGMAIFEWGTTFYSRPQTTTELIQMVAQCAYTRPSLHCYNWQITDVIFLQSCFERMAKFVDMVPSWWQLFSHFSKTNIYCTILESNFMKIISTHIIPLTSSLFKLMLALLSLSAPFCCPGGCWSSSLPPQLTMFLSNWFVFSGSLDLQGDFKKSRCAAKSPSLLETFLP